MNDVSFSKEYNCLISILAILNAYFSIIPHFNGKTIDVDHKILVVVIGIFFLLFLSKSRLKISRGTGFALLIAVISGIFVSFHAPVSFEYYTKWILFAVAILLYIMCLSNAGQINESTLKLVFICSALPFVFYLLESFDSSYYTHTRIGYKLMLTFENENSAAMQLLLISGIFFLYARRCMDQHKRLLTAVCFIMIFIDTYLIFLTKSRSSLLAVLFTLVFFIFDRFDFLINRKTIFIGILFPLVFALIFVSLYRHGHESIILLGRNLFNGREVMWDSVFQQPLSNLLFGSYHVYTRDTGKIPFQLHNGVVDMIASYGVIITGCFLCALNKVLRIINSQGTKMATLIVICCLALMIQSSGEAALLIGNRCNFICMLFVFLNADAAGTMSYEGENEIR